jgi:hypothetical protein
VHSAENSQVYKHGQYMNIDVLEEHNAYIFRVEMGEVRIRPGLVTRIVFSQISGKEGKDTVILKVIL